MMYPCQFTGDRMLCCLRQRPQAQAELRGCPAMRQIVGTARFYQTPQGVLMAICVRGLPQDGNPCSGGVFALHIHEGSSCTGSPAFADAGGHFNPGDCPHPNHAGDLPPLFASHGFAWCAVLLDRFALRQIVGKALVIHAGADDFTSQPAGDSGPRIACGVIQPLWGCRCGPMLMPSEILPTEEKKDTPKPPSQTASHEQPAAEELFAEVEMEETLELIPASETADDEEETEDADSVQVPPEIDIACDVPQ